MPAAKEGAVDFRDIADGGIQVRMVLGKFSIGGLKLSSDRRWLAMEQHEHIPPGVLLPPSKKFDVGVWDMKAMKQQTTISSCSLMLDVATGGKVIAVVREKQIELWGAATSKSNIDNLVVDVGPLTRISHEPIVTRSVSEGGHASYPHLRFGLR